MVDMSRKDMDMEARKKGLEIKIQGIRSQWKSEAWIIRSAGACAEPEKNLRRQVANI